MLTIIASAAYFYVLDMSASDEIRTEPFSNQAEITLDSKVDASLKTYSVPDMPVFFLDVDQGGCLYETAQASPAVALGDPYLSGIAAISILDDNENGVIETDDFFHQYMRFAEPENIGTCLEFPAINTQNSRFEIDLSGNEEIKRLVGGFMLESRIPILIEDIYSSERSSGWIYVVMVESIN
jgi:hypothetical protein